MNNQKIGVLGAGQMGSGIAQVCATAGLDVLLYDIAPDRGQKALEAIKRSLGTLKQKGKISGEIESILNHIYPQFNIAELGVCDVIIEAVAEDEKIKSDAFKALTPHLNPKTILATNTSSLSISRLAAATDRPDRFIGMHFMNPVPLMKLVEIIRGFTTSVQTFTVIQELAQKLGKDSVIAEDYPGFITNRILMPMINEAIFALHEGVGTVDAIDKAMHLGMNHTMGPLALADFIGLDTCLAIMKVLHQGFHDSKYRPCPLLVKYVEAGMFGRKTKRGFYDYNQTPPQPTR